MINKKIINKITRLWNKDQNELAWFIYEIEFSKNNSIEDKSELELLRRIIEIKQMM